MTRTWALAITPLLLAAAAASQRDRVTTGGEVVEFGTGTPVAGAEVQLVRQPYPGLPRSLHRFLPVLLEIEGARLCELPVAHRPRRYGHSKYGVWNRLPQALADLFFVARMRRGALRYRAQEQHRQR